jgi:hypothetical protein
MNPPWNNNKYPHTMEMLPDNNNKLFQNARDLLFRKPLGGSSRNSSSKTPASEETSSESSESSSCRKRSRRGVQFQDESSTPPQSIPQVYKELTLDHAQELWYQSREISAFKAQTRNLVIFGKQGEQDDLSGLERFNLERSKHKKRTIRCVILASRKKRRDSASSLLLLDDAANSILTTTATAAATTASPEDNFVSEVSQQCTAVSTDMALVQGFNDFCQVYDPLAALLGSNECIGNYNEYFFSHQHHGGGHGDGGERKEEIEPRGLVLGGGSLPLLQPSLFSASHHRENPVRYYR